jgi:hypothetical protein
MSATNMFQERQRNLLKVMEDAENFLQSQRSGIAASPFNNGCVNHINMRLLLQVHVTNLIEASSDYDRAVWAMNESNETERREKILMDAGLLPKKG